MISPHSAPFSLLIWNGSQVFIFFEVVLVAHYLHTSDNIISSTVPKANRFLVIVEEIKRFLFRSRLAFHHWALSDWNESAEVGERRDHQLWQWPLDVNYKWCLYRATFLYPARSLGVLSPFFVAIRASVASPKITLTVGTAIPPGRVPCIAAGNDFKRRKYPPEKNRWRKKTSQANLWQSGMMGRKKGLARAGVSDEQLQWRCHLLYEWWWLFRRWCCQGPRRRMMYTTWGVVSPSSWLIALSPIQAVWNTACCTDRKVPGNGAWTRLLISEVAFLWNMKWASLLGGKTRAGR